MDTHSELPWAGEIRRALRAAVRRHQGENTSAEMELHIHAAIEAGWRIPEDSYKDFWETARAIAGLDGSLKQFPIQGFMKREVERLTPVV
jgi:hypothetical protein